MESASWRVGDVEVVGTSAFHDGLSTDFDDIESFH
jgi:hypothetical protein